MDDGYPFGLPLFLLHIFPHIMIHHQIYDRGNGYLSGGMQFAKDLGADWRITATEEFKKMKYWAIDIAQLEKDYQKKYNFNITDALTKENDYVQFKANVRQHFVHSDLSIIDNDADFVLLYYDASVGKGAGTISEAQHTYNVGKPLFVVVDALDETLKMPWWLDALSTAKFSSFGDCFDYLQELPYGILKTDKYGNYATGQQYLCNLCGTVFNKRKHSFVSKVTPTYCKNCVNTIVHTREILHDRYEFITERLNELSTQP